MMNVVALTGRLSRPAAERILQSGDRLVNLEVTVAGPAGNETVPVVWPDPPASALALDVDQNVTVIGRVRRRFFRTVNGTGSRTEVVADTVVPAHKGKRVDTAIERARQRLSP
ncbi:MAG: single-stranded DNA-binding protein [Actinobacteria bacterium]|nr:single-stranded DNA-binding protein [Actinomycetota bacterium]